jgi:hypothetical protein
MEGVNVGVAVFCEKPLFFRLRTTKSARRVQYVFGAKAIDSKQFRQLLLGAEHRAAVAASGFRKVSEFEAFVSRECNQLSYTEPRSLSTEIPGRTLDDLYGRLVERAVARPKIRGVRELLAEELRKPAFHDLISHDIPVVLPELGSEIVVPHGFMNGKPNLIQTARFQRDTASSLLGQTGRLQLEGELLHKHKMKLIVVAEFLGADTSASNRVSRILRERNTDLYRVEELDKLLEHIRKTAKPSTVDVFGRLG